MKTTTVELEEEEEVEVRCTQSCQVYLATLQPRFWKG